MYTYYTDSICIYIYTHIHLEGNCLKMHGTVQQKSLWSNFTMGHSTKMGGGVKLFLIFNPTWGNDPF